MVAIHWASGRIGLIALFMALPFTSCDHSSLENRISSIEQCLDSLERSSNSFDSTDTALTQSNNSSEPLDTLERSDNKRERLDRLRSSQEHRNRILSTRKTPMERWVESSRPYDGTLSSKIPEPARSALQNAAEFELLSLDPARPEKRYPDDYFRRWVLGGTRIQQANVREQLLAALDKGVREFDEDNDDVSDCFDPRHAIRVEHEGKSIYILVCFECHQVYVYINDQLERDKWFPIKGAAQPVFDEVLRAAGIPLPEPDSN